MHAEYVTGQGGTARATLNGGFPVGSSARTDDVNDNTNTAKHEHPISDRAQRWLSLECRGASDTPEP